MQIFLNGHELDLKPQERIVITKQINDLADVSQAKTQFTNKFKVPKTAKNIATMEFLGVAGTQTRIQYRLNNVTVVENSIPLIVNGHAVIDQTDRDFYNLNIYGSEKTFFEKLKNLTLKDVYPDRNILWTANNLRNFINSNADFCFPMLQYNAETYFKGSFTDTSAVYIRTKASKSTPVFFVKNMFERIFEHLGYVLVYPMRYDAIFGKFMFPAQKGVSYFSVRHGDTFNLRNCMRDDISTDEFVREVMWRYGLLVQVDEFEKKVTFTKLDDLIKTAPIVDWTDNLHEFKSESYTIGAYARKNLFKYGEDTGNHNLEMFVDNQLQGSFTIDNETLTAEHTVIESKVVRPKVWGVRLTNEHSYGRIFFHNYNNNILNSYCLNVAEDTQESNGELKPKEVPFYWMYLANIGTGLINFTFIDDNGNNSTQVQVQPRGCTLDNLSFQKFIDQNYIQTRNLLNNVNVMKCQMRLSLIDFYQFNFFSRIYLEQFGSFFYVNKISNWQNDTLCEVELVKIPPVISSNAGGGYGYNTTQMIGSL